MDRNDLLHKGYSLFLVLSGYFTVGEIPLESLVVSRKLLKYINCCNWHVFCIINGIIIVFE